MTQVVTLSQETHVVFLTRQVPFLKQKRADEVNELLASCCSEFGLVVDGSPCFAEAFAMLLQVADKNAW